MKTIVAIVNKIPSVTTSMAGVYRVVLPDTSDPSAIYVKKFYIKFLFVNKNALRVIYIEIKLNIQLYREERN